MNSAVTRRLPPRRATWLLLLPALTALPTATASTAFASTATQPASPAATCACTPRPAATPADTLALSPGATLAAPQILPLTAPTLGLRQRHQDLAGRHQPHNSPTSPAHPRTSAAAPSPTPPPVTSDFPPRTAAPTTAPHTASPVPTPTPAAQPSPGPHVMPISTALGIGALAAAALTAALATRRARRSNTAAHPPTPTHATRTGDDLIRLDRALHALARDEDDALPALRAALITAHTVRLLPDTPHAPPPPSFTAAADGWWTLTDATSLSDEPAAPKATAPYPALVSTGHTPAGDLLLLNLAHTPAVLLEGRPDHITEVCTSLALELALSPWAGQTEIVTTGFGADLPQLLPAAGITHQPDAAHALRDLSERLLEAHQRRDLPHPPYVVLCADPLDTSAARDFAHLTGNAAAPRVTLIAPARTAAAHFPHAVLLNASHDAPQHLHSTGTDIRLQRLSQAAYHRITTALTTDSQPHKQPDSPATQPQHEHQDQPRTAPPPGPPAPQPSRHPAQHTHPSPDSTDSTARGEASRSGGSGNRGDSHVFPALLAATTHPATPRPAGPIDPAGPRPASRAQAPGTPPAQKTPATAAPDAEATPVSTAPSRPTRPQHAKDAGTGRAAPDPHAPEIKVLGPIEVSGVPSTGHGPRTAQLAALLYFRPDRNANTLCTAMDPANPWSPATLNARIHGLRRALGNDPTGQPYLPRRTSGNAPYRLAAAVRCDWIRFLHLTEHALPLGPAGLTDLEAALALVRGRPFGTQPPPWAEPHQQEMITRIIDTAHTIATHRTPPGPHHNLTLARHAITVGLDIDEHAELLYRDWIRIEDAAGNRPGLHTAITRVQHLTHTLDAPLQPETQQLIQQLLHATGHERHPQP
ncbi:bacterial transcriptional activator domain-containing protein [Streptomyces adustus]